MFPAVLCMIKWTFLDKFCSDNSLQRYERSIDKAVNIVKPLKFLITDQRMYINNNWSLVIILNIEVNSLTCIKIFDIE